MMLASGYEGLRRNAALLDLKDRTMLRVAGSDRARLLHAMSTNHVEELKFGGYCYAFFLDAQGHILADAHVLCTSDSILLDSEPEMRQALRQHLDKYIIADDATVEDYTERYAVFGVEGPRAREVIENIGVDPVPDAGQWVPWDTRLVAPISATGAPGYRIYAPAGDHQALREQMFWSGTVEVTAEDIRTARIENAHPRFGEEFGSTNLPQETRLMHALHFNKGCYLGQEIVERIRSRGRVNKVLAQMLISTTTVPARGAKVKSGPIEIGQIVTAAYSPGLGQVAAMAYLPAEKAVAGVAITVDQVPAVVSGRAPA